MPIPSDYRDIVTMLLTKTDQGLVQWRRDRFDTTVSIDGSRFSIWAGNDEHSEEPFVAFALQDAKGSTLDSWYVEEQEGSDYVLMLRLYSGAKRHASGVPDKLRVLREKIANSKIVGNTGDA